MAMRTIFHVGVIFLVLPRAWGDPISVEQFKELTLPDEGKALSEAPPEMRPELEKIYEHNNLISQFSGEARFRNEKEGRIAKARGFTCLEMIFGLQMNMWDGYIAAVMDSNEKAKIPLEQRQEVENNLKGEESTISKRWPIVHSLIFNLAPSSAALELEKKAEQLADKLIKRQTIVASTPYRPITKEERVDVDKQIDEIYEELQALPKLTPGQAQKEYDAFSDEQFMRSDGLTGGTGAGSN